MLTPECITCAARRAGIALVAHERLDALLREVERLSDGDDLVALRQALALARAETEDPTSTADRAREFEAVRRSGALRGTVFERGGGY